MKKTTAVAVMMVVVLAWGAAHAAEEGGAGENVRPYNGITYFDLGPAAKCDEPAGGTERSAQIRPFNGITAFDPGQPGSGAKGACANRPASQTMTVKAYNGITVF